MKKIFAVFAALSIFLCSVGCSSDSGGDESESELVFSNLGDITVIETAPPVIVTDDSGNTVTDEEGAALTSIPPTTQPPESGGTDAPSNSTKAPSVTTVVPKQTDPAAQTTRVTVAMTTQTPNPAQAEIPENSTIITLGSTVKIDGVGASADGSHVLINKGGKYCLSGKLTNGQIEVNTLDKVHLYFNGVNVKNSNGPAVLITNAQRLKLTLMDGSINYIEDGGADKTNNGAFFTNDTLEIKGEGALYVKGNNREGIASDDDIIVESGSLYIQSYDDGLNANDDISIIGGYVYIVAGGDGIDSKGTTSISGGTVIVAGTGADESAIESDGVLTMSGGTFVGVGGTGLLKTPATSSAQHTMLFKYQNVKAAGTLISLLSGSKPIAAFSPASSYSSFTISAPTITSGSEYALHSGGTCSGTKLNGLYSGGTCSGGENLGSFAISSKVSGFNVK